MYIARFPFLKVSLSTFLAEDIFQKGKGGTRQKEVMPAGVFLLGFLEKKKEDKRERKEVKRMGRKAMICPVIARNVVGETF